MADEAADVSNKENLSLVVRFVDSSGNIREEFVGFHLCEEGTTGEAVKDLILKSINELGLNMDDCRGQSYDGAGNMAGKYCGASTLIQHQFKKAIYVHYMNHRLDLCFADTCSLPLVRNMIETVRKLSDFFNNSPKRQYHLVERVKELLPNSNHTILVDVCRTRWIARLDGLDRIVELLFPLLATLEDIALDRNGDGVVGAGNWNTASRDDAQALINAVSFQFVVTLVVVKYIFGLTRPATVKLQRQEMQILTTKEEISSLKDALKEMNDHLDQRHNQLYQEAVLLSQKIGVQPSKPRTVQRQVFGANNPSSSPESYYRINLTQVFLAHTLQQIESRFPPEAYICFKGFSIMPAVLLKNFSTWKSNVEEFCQYYSQDIPNISGLLAELDLWQRLWTEKKEKKEGIPEKISSAIKMVDKVAFPNVYSILKILATIPVTSCSCERPISSLRNLKTYLRSTMRQERLNGLALINSHRDIELNLEEIIDLLATRYPRIGGRGGILEW